MTAPTDRRKCSLPAVLQFEKGIATPEAFLRELAASARAPNKLPVWRGVSNWPFNYACLAALGSDAAAKEVLCPVRAITARAYH